MKKLGKSSKKGFTLVELIVVIVILAVLAAMLVPALIGYIDRARKEKDYQAASVVYAAAQAAITEAYAKGDIKDKGAVTITQSGSKFDGTVDYGPIVKELAGVDDKVEEFSFTTDANLVIQTGTVKINNGGSEVTYELKADGSWGVV